MLTRRMLGVIALLALALLSASCTRTDSRMYSFEARVACEAVPCGCGTVALASVSGGPLGEAGESIHSFVAEGQVVNAEAVPESGWTFSHWTGDAAEADEPIEILVDRGVELIAHFERIRPLRTLELHVSGDGGVEGGPCFPQNTEYLSSYTPETAQYGDGEVLRLRHYRAPGWMFAGWIGYSTEEEIEVVMDRDRSITLLLHDNEAHAYGPTPILGPQKTSGTEGD